jgi:hypothetical protein
MQFTAIIVLSIVMAVVYGIAHDQVTARICVEYFTIGHPPVFGTDDPTLLGIGWGIIATWWVGLILGVPLAVAARFGHRPKRDAHTLVWPLAWLMGFSAVLALTSGIIGWSLASLGCVELVGHMADAVPPDRHVAFLANGFAHTSSYAAGFLGGIVVIVQVWRSRNVGPASTADR